MSLQKLTAEYTLRKATKIDHSICGSSVFIVFTASLCNFFCSVLPILHFNINIVSNASRKAHYHSNYHGVDK